MEWAEAIKYIDSGVLLLIVVLFIKGCIVSRRTVTDMRVEMQKERDDFKITLNTVCESHRKETQRILSSFDKRMKDFMKVIKVFKKQNGIK